MAIGLSGLANSLNDYYGERQRIGRDSYRDDLMRQVAQAQPDCWNVATTTTGNNIIVNQCEVRVEPGPKSYREELQQEIDEWLK